MDTVAVLDQLQRDANRDQNLKKELLETRHETNPLQAFCTICREKGYELYEMEVINAGEEFYASMRRSTNGGGENSPLLEWEDDFYELFLAGLE